MSQPENTPMATGIGMRAALLLFLAPSMVALNAQPASAEIKCTTKSYVCVDSRQGARLCITTVCIDDKGEIVSTDTIVLKDDGQTGTGGQKGKVQLRDMNVMKKVDKATSK
jgi:hypothetical protein